jgi:hypothetical protein
MVKVQFHVLDFYAPIIKVFSNVHIFLIAKNIIYVSIKSQGLKRKLESDDDGDDKEVGKGGPSSSSAPEHQQWNTNGLKYFASRMKAMKPGDIRDRILERLREAIETIEST